MRKLELRTGHKMDVWFSVEPLQDSKYNITKMFTNLQKCLDYIHEQSKGR